MAAAHGDRWGHDRKHPGTIALPTGWRPEGIAIKGSSVYVGSIPTGAVWKGDVHTRPGRHVRPGASRPCGDRHRGRSQGPPVGRRWWDRPGLRVRRQDRRRRCHVAARARRRHDVHQRRRRDQGRRLVHATPSPACSTRCRSATTARCPPRRTCRRVPLTGDWAPAASPNANGIVATHGGRWLIVVQTTTGKLFRVDSTTGAADEIDLGGKRRPERRRPAARRAQAVRRAEPPEPGRRREAELAARQRHGQEASSRTIASTCRRRSPSTASGCTP